MSQKTLLAIIELGGYPDFRPLYESLGYEVVVLTQMRKALRYLKQNKPDVIVAEFNFQSDFRDRSSNLESMLAMLQKTPATMVIVFYDKEFQPAFERLQNRFNLPYAMPFPIDEPDLKQLMRKL